MNLRLLSLLLCLSTLLTHTQSVFAEELTPAEQQRRVDLERRRVKAEQAEARERITAVGIDESDCIEQARYRASRTTSSVISRCDRQTDGFYRCGVVSKRIIDYSSYISSVSGSGEYNESRSNEYTCRSAAINRSEQSALSACNEKYGVSCVITQRGDITSSRAYKRRRYFIFGPKELRHECIARASAEPPSQYRVQCSIEVVAKAQL